jgi:hypothetical protein
VANGDAIGMEGAVEATLRTDDENMSRLRSKGSVGQRMCRY